MMTEELKKLNCSPLEVRLFLEDARGCVSSGTMASLIEIFDSSSGWEILSMSSPYYLNPRDQKTTRPILPHGNARLSLKASDNALLGYDFSLKCWTAPYIMQFIDTRVVNRSNALQNWSYGKHFVFAERMKISNILYATIISIVFIICNLLLINPFTRKIVKRFIPHTGVAPSTFALEHGYFKILLIGTGIDRTTGKQVTIQGRIVAMNGDPGYRQTAKMSVESALALVQDSASLSQTYGVLTPSVALGVPLIHRLQQKNITFTIDK
jgi:short subunit dehydrogenase-like uncharacterized protein